jgi:hypothetical protein
MFQQVAVAAIVLTAFAFITRKVWRTVASARKPAGAGCDSGCGCAAPTQAVHAHAADERRL